MRAKGRKNEAFRLDSGVTQKCAISLWVFIVYINVVMKELKLELRRFETKVSNDGKE